MINEIRRMQQLAGIKPLNEITIKSNLFFKTQDEDKDDETIYMELLDRDNNKHGWFGHVENNNSYLDVEFLFEEGEDQTNEMKNMNELIEYCNKYKIKYNHKDLNGDGELIYIQIPLKYIDIDLSKISD